MIEDESDRAKVRPLWDRERMAMDKIRICIRARASDYGPTIAFRDEQSRFEVVCRAYGFNRADTGKITPVC